jgi:hypothetical protein
LPRTADFFDFAVVAAHEIGSSVQNLPMAFGQPFFDRQESAQMDQSPFSIELWISSVKVARGSL